MYKNQGFKITRYDLIQFVCTFKEDILEDATDPENMRMF